MDGFRMVWGPWWPRYPVHCGPRLNLGLCGWFQRFHLSKINPVNDGETVLAGACARLDKDAFLEERAHGSFDRGITQLSVALNRTLGAPDT